MAEPAPTLTAMTATYTPVEAIRHAHATQTPENAAAIERAIRDADRVVEMIPMDQQFLAAVMALQPGEAQQLVPLHRTPCGCHREDGSVAFPG